MDLKIEPFFIHWTKQLCCNYEELHVLYIYIYIMKEDRKNSVIKLSPIKTALT